MLAAEQHLSRAPRQSALWSAPSHRGGSTVSRRRKFLSARAINNPTSTYWITLPIDAECVGSPGEMPVSSSVAKPTAVQPDFP